MVRYQLVQAIRYADQRDSRYPAVAMERYRDLYPDWSIIYYAIENKDRRKYKKELLRIIWMMVKYDLLSRH